MANKSVFDDPFGAGVNIRGTVEFPLTLAGLPGHQGFTALYSTQDGTDLASLDGIHLPSPQPGTVTVKDSRYYFAWLFDQQLYRAPGNAAEGFGLFGQLGVSDGNPNGLRWSLLAGIGGKGLIPGRSNDNWGIGYYYDSFSQDLKDALAPISMPIPSFEQLLQPTLDALRQADGVTTIKAIDDQVIHSLALAPEDIAQPHGDTPQTELEYRLAWARTYLKQYGLIDNPKRGAWTLTEQGRATEQVDPKTVSTFVQELIKQGKVDSENRPMKSLAELAWT